MLGDQLGIFTDEAGFEGTVDDEDGHGDAVGVEDLDRTPIGLCQSDVVDLAGFNDAAGQPNRPEEGDGVGGCVGVDAGDRHGCATEQFLGHLPALGEEPDEPFGIAGEPPSLFVNRYPR